MSSFWAPVVAAFVAAVVPAIGMVVTHRQLKAAERREGEAAARADEAERHRIEIERQHNALTREVEFHRRLETVLLRAHSDDPTQRDSGFIDLADLRDGALSSPERSALVQAHIDRINQTRMGRTVVRIVDDLDDHLAAMPAMPPRDPSSPIGEALWDRLRRLDESLQRSNSVMRLEGERFRQLGQGLIEGAAFRPTSGRS